MALRSEFAASQQRQSMLDHSSSADSPPSAQQQPQQPSITPTIPGIQRQQQAAGVEEDPRDLFWTLFPKADPPEELERLATLRVQKSSRGNRAEDA